MILISVLGRGGWGGVETRRRLLFAFGEKGFFGGSGWDGGFTVRVINNPVDSKSTASGHCQSSRPGYLKY
jgi:hypothetical protein